MAGASSHTIHTRRLPERRVTLRLGADTGLSAAAAVGVVGPAGAPVTTPAAAVLNAASEGLFMAEAAAAASSCEAQEAAPAADMPVAVVTAGAAAGSAAGGVAPAPARAPAAADGGAGGRCPAAAWPTCGSE